MMKGVQESSNGTVRGNGSFPGVIRITLRNDPEPLTEKYSRKGALVPRPNRILHTVGELGSHFRQTMSTVRVNTVGMEILQKVAPGLAARATVDPQLDVAH